MQFLIFVTSFGVLKKFIVCRMQLYSIAFSQGANQIFGVLLSLQS